MWMFWSPALSGMGRSPFMRQWMSANIFVTIHQQSHSGFLERETLKLKEHSTIGYGTIHHNFKTQHTVIETLQGPSLQSDRNFDEIAQIETDRRKWALRSTRSDSEKLPILQTVGDDWTETGPIEHWHSNVLRKCKIWTLEQNRGAYELDFQIVWSTE